VKAGFTRVESRRYLCCRCGRTYTPEPKARGRGEETRASALEYYAAYLSLREIGSLLSVSHETVRNWVEACAEVSAADELTARVRQRRDAERQSAQFLQKFARLMKARGA
jgi:transposase-like protein